MSGLSYRLFEQDGNRSILCPNFISPDTLDISINIECEIRKDRFGLLAIECHTVMSLDLSGC